MTQGAAVMLVLFVAICLWLLPKLQTRLAMNKLTETEPPMAENEFRKTLAQIIGGIVVILGLSFTWDEAQNTKAQLTLATNKLEDERKARAFDQQIAQDRLMTDRFARAIDQLGKQDDISVRLGGIYALERISKDSDNDYYWSVIEVLAGFLKQNSPAKVTELGDEVKEKRLDVEAAITVLGRRNPKLDKEVLNLNFLDFDGAMLRKASFPKASMFGSSFRGAWLEGANLQEAVLTASNMQSSNVAGANLQNANFMGAQLQSADFSYADLSHAIFYEAKLEEATLVKAKLNGSEMVHANLDSANLTSADLRDADLEVSSLKEAVLTDADLTGARLAGVNLSGALVTQEQIDKACGSEQTVLPKNLKIKKICPYKPPYPYQDEKGVRPPPS